MNQSTMECAFRNALKSIHRERATCVEPIVYTQEFEHPIPYTGMDATLDASAHTFEFFSGTVTVSASFTPTECMLHVFWGTGCTDLDVANALADQLNALSEKSNSGWTVEDEIESASALHLCTAFPIPLSDVFSEENRLQHVQFMMSMMLGVLSNGPIADVLKSLVSCFED